MFLNLKKFERRTEELKWKRYFGFTEIPDFTVLEDTADRDTVHYAISRELYDSAETMRIGDTYSGRDKYLWLYKKIRLPKKKDGCKTVGIFDFGKTGFGNTSGFESLLYVDGTPYQGVDTNHGDVVFDGLDGKETELVFLLWTGLEGGGDPQIQTHRLSCAKNRVFGYGGG